MFSCHASMYPFLLAVPSSCFVVSTAGWYTSHILFWCMLLVWQNLAAKTPLRKTIFLDHQFGQTCPSLMPKLTQISQKTWAKCYSQKAVVIVTKNIYLHFHIHKNWFELMILEIKESYQRIAVIVPFFVEIKNILTIFIIHWPIARLNKIRKITCPEGK